jgi:hypothetical protein
MSPLGDIQILDSGFRRNDYASVGVLNPIENKNECVLLRLKKLKHGLNRHLINSIFFVSL